MRVIRSQADSLLQIDEKELAAMRVGLAHRYATRLVSARYLNTPRFFVSSLSRYKLKFSPDKVDTMIVQAICTFVPSSFDCHGEPPPALALLDDLDKETNNYIMRCKEWYGWHFPELAKIIADNIAFCKTVQRIGMSLVDGAVLHSSFANRLPNQCCRSRSRRHSACRCRSAGERSSRDIHGHGNLRRRHNQCPPPV